MIGRENLSNIYSETRDVFNTRDALVIYDTSAFSGWKLVNVISYANLLENVYFIRNTIFILGMFGVLGAILISFIISNRIIRPLTEIYALIQVGSITNLKKHISAMSVC